MSKLGSPIPPFGPSVCSCSKIFISNHDHNSASSCPLFSSHFGVSAFKIFSFYLTPSLELAKRQLRGKPLVRGETHDLLPRFQYSPLRQRTQHLLLRNPPPSFCQDLHTGTISPGAVTARRGRHALRFSQRPARRSKSGCPSGFAAEPASSPPAPPAARSTPKPPESRNSRAYCISPAWRSNSRSNWELIQ